MPRRCAENGAPRVDAARATQLRRRRSSRRSASALRTPIPWAAHFGGDVRRLASDLVAGLAREPARDVECRDEADDTALIAEDRQVVHALSRHERGAARERIV